MNPKKKIMFWVQRDGEEEIKALRNSLTFRASPLPNFYHGGMKAEKPELLKVAMLFSFH
jgi:hypothetical protein